MRLTSDLRCRHVSRPSRPVPASVPTSSQVGQGCPDRPDLLRARTYRAGIYTIPNIQNRSGQSGRLGQPNGGNGFGRPDLAKQVGTVGTVGAARVSRESIDPVAGDGMVRGSSLSRSVTGSSDLGCSLVMGFFQGGSGYE